MYQCLNLVVEKILVSSQTFSNFWPILKNSPAAQKILLCGFIEFSKGNVEN